ncbi:MAG: recombinase family protein, partial [Planctomycetota bacterium]|nr:recombinase family protein [Planctomycetota bacterium]
MDKRRGLVTAIDALGKGDVLLVAKRDRLARDTLMACWLETEISKRGARIVSASGDGSDDDSPTSVLMRRIIDAFAEYERLMIRARTKAAMQVKRQRGERLGRFIAYGYRLGDGKKLEPVRHEQEAIALMLELRSSGMALAKIGEDLEDRG